MRAATQKAGHMTAPDQSLQKRHFSLARREPSTHERQALTWASPLSEASAFSNIRAFNNRLAGHSLCLSVLGDDFAPPRSA
jgi:hypothetical protein